MATVRHDGAPAAAPDGGAPHPGEHKVLRSGGGISGAFADIAAIDGSLEARARISGGTVIVSLVPRADAATPPAK
ncbi:hypothetical protein [Xanthobacter pseudotagetidis]|uniref:hypothetical protein n=1 Tax=Xanthobacter pseudotagetidis TaxID=3119911 RepID=UPI0037284927